MSDIRCQKRCRPTFRNGPRVKRSITIQSQSPYSLQSLSLGAFLTISPRRLSPTESSTAFAYPSSKYPSYFSTTVFSASAKSSNVPAMSSSRSLYAGPSPLSSPTYSNASPSKPRGYGRIRTANVSTTTPRSSGPLSQTFSSMLLS